MFTCFVWARCSRRGPLKEARHYLTTPFSQDQKVGVATPGINAVKTEWIMLLWSGAWLLPSGDGSQHLLRLEFAAG